MLTYKTDIFPNFKFTDDFRILNLDNTEANVPREGGKVFISPVGKRKGWYSLTWLTLLAAYNTPCVPEIVNRLYDIDFKKYKGDKSYHCVRLGYYMVFKNPIKIKDRYRIVPCFPFIAVSRCGEIFNVAANDNMDSKISINNGYKTCPAYGLTIRLHRLVAHAWVPNDDFSIRYIVNHIDGDKENNHYTNLEWCTFKENSEHASRAGLMSNVLRCRTRDFYTGEVKEYHSIVALTRALYGEDRCNLTVMEIKTRNPSNLWLDRYEIRVDGDDRPWFYEGKTEVVENGKHEITVTEPNGVVNVFRRIIDFKRHYKLWNVGSSAVKLKKALLERCPDFTVDVISDLGIREVQAKHLSSGCVYIFNSIKQASRETKQSFAQIRRRLHRPVIEELNGWAYRWHTAEPWPEVKKNVYSNQRVILKHFNNGNIKEFPSLKKTAKWLQVSRDKIKNASITGNKIKGWTVSIEV